MDEQLGRTRIEAPFDGVVIRGDLSQSLGSPVQRGDVLLTVAPRERFRVIVEVDERDIGGSAWGSPAAWPLSALPWTRWRSRWPGSRRWPPRSEGRNVFEVEARLDAQPDTLRPGLRGVARIAVGREPLLWAWTHRLVERLRPGGLVLAGALEMSGSVFSSQWYRVAGLHPSLRPHLRVTRQIHRREVWYVLADPLTGRFHRMNAAAYAFVGRCDGRHSVEALSEALPRRGPDEALTQDEIVRLLVQLNQRGLIHCELTPDVAIFHRERQDSCGSSAGW